MELAALPDLTDPVMITAFQGWNDAGEAASGLVEHLAAVWGSHELTALDPEDYYDFQVNRPTVSITDDGNRRLAWPTTRVSVAYGALGRRDVVLVHGIEPNIRWRMFLGELLALADDLDVSLVINVGALLADAPHTRPVPITGTSFDEELAQRLGLDRSRYEGPTGIVGVLQDACDKLDIPAMSLWAAVPHYVAQPPCPKATLALLNKLEDLLDTQIDQGDLPEEARAWEHGVDELASEDSDIAEYVQSLEHAKDTAELPEASGEAIAREFERYLRRRTD